MAAPISCSLAVEVSVPQSTKYLLSNLDLFDRTDCPGHFNSFSPRRR